MNQAVHNKLISFIWSIADDCLRDVYARGKYRDVILPMVVLRRLDALLEPTKVAVLEELVSEALWTKQLELLSTATELMQALGNDEYSDFNLFKEKVDAICKCRDKACLISNSDKNAILNAVSWYDATAEKVIKATTKLAGDKLEQLLNQLDCKKKDLANYGYFATNKKAIYLEYETVSDLRDTENRPPNSTIYSYFVREVKPHVAEAWINQDTTKIGYEISF